jgi:hypothetical protein
MSSTTLQCTMTTPSPGSKDRGDAPQELFLPSVRTPLFSPDAPPASTTAQPGPFFRLPPELRRMVLIAAFGARTLHVELDFDFPPLRRPGAHCELWAAASGPRAFLRRDVRGPVAWRWRSAVCHREAPGRPWSGRHLSTDGCLGGRAECCECWAGEAPGRCFVGVLGWLRSCRQA